MCAPCSAVVATLVSELTPSQTRLGLRLGVDAAAVQDVVSAHSPGGGRRDVPARVDGATTSAGVCRDGALVKHE